MAAAELLGDKAYGSAELREWLSERNPKPVVPIDRIENSPRLSLSRRCYRLVDLV
jgi:hypothetical protein